MKRIAYHTSVASRWLAVLLCALILPMTAGAQSDVATAIDTLTTAVDTTGITAKATAAVKASAEEASISEDSIRKTVDSIATAADSLAVLLQPTLLEEEQPRRGRNWSTWRPDPQRALWLALVIPGGGQIYNRKYWKLPIVYGGFIGCIYAMTWNNMMYHDYQQAYLDIMDDDPNTASYNKFLHLGRKIDDSNVERYKKLFKSRKDKYRRWRDLSFFTMLGIYVVSVIDAYVDAELSEFDISKDLSLKVRPTVIGNKMATSPLYSASLGVNCSIKF